MKYTLLFFTLISTLCLAKAQSLQDSLLFHLPMDGDGTDVSGNNHNGVLMGATPTADRFGTTDGALQFGQDKYLTWQAVPALKPQYPMSFSFWVNFDDFPTLGRAIICTDYMQNRYYGVLISLDNDRHLRVNIGNGGVATSTSRVSKTATTAFEINRWYHVAIVIRDLRDISIYINGCEESGDYSGTGDMLRYSNNQLGTLGRIDDSQNDVDPITYLQGKLDDLWYWKREITPVEIQNLYDNFAGIYMVDIGPDTTICDNQILILHAVSPDTVESYTWQDGSTGPDYAVDESGQYIVSAQINGCIFKDTVVVIAESCKDCMVIVPNMFTPDGNQKNDLFRVLYNADHCSFSQFQLKVYNRWGKMVFKTNDPTQGWNGDYINKRAPSEVYVFDLKYQFADVETVGYMKGSVTLIR